MIENTTVIEPAPAPSPAPTDTSPQDGDAQEKLVPVTEAIRYRKRAQAAEQQLQSLQEQLAHAAEELAAAREQIDQIERRRSIDEQLIQADTIDLQAARLLTEAAVSQMDDAQISEVIDDLRRHKPYLFRQRSSSGGMSPRLRAGAEDLDHAAATAASTGDRRDLLRYLRMRRRSS